MNDKETVKDTLLCPKVIDDDSGEQEQGGEPTKTLPRPYQFGRKDTLRVSE